MLAAPLGVLSQGLISPTPNVNNFTIASKFQLDTGMLYYDRLDSTGRIVERIEKFFLVPPTPECNMTTYGDFKKSLDAQGLFPLTQFNFTED